MGPFTCHLARIPEVEEEVASVKDSVTSKLPAQGHKEGMEASGLSRRPTTPEFKFAESFMAGDGGGEEVEKTAFVPHKEERKGKLSQDPRVETSWKLTDFLGPAKELISLVGKSTGMPNNTSGCFVPQIAGLVK